MSLPVMDSTSPLHQQYHLPTPVNKQAVCILLECFLVSLIFFLFLFGVKGPLRSISFYILKPIFSKTLLPFWGFALQQQWFLNVFSMDILTGKKLTSTYLLQHIFYIKILRCNLMSVNKSVKEHNTQLVIWGSSTTVSKSIVHTDLIRPGRFKTTLL